MKVKHIIMIGFALLLAHPLALHAQIPRTLSYQAIVTDAAGELKPDGSYTFTFRLYDASSGGTALWTESKTISVKDGLFFTALGDQVVFPASLRFDRPFWLSIQVASEAELSPRIPLTSVGYSFSTLRADSAQHAARADTAQVVTAAVTATNLADDAVTSAKILDGTIQSGDVAASFTAPYADTSHYADTSDYALAAPPGGSAGGDLSGTYPDPTIADGSVTTAKIDPTGAVSGQALMYIGTSVQWQEPPVSAADITAVNAGDGLTGGGTTGDVTLSVDFTGSTGSAITAARSDHGHAGEDITSGIVAEARIDATITRDTELTDHTSNASAHHNPYTDTDALAAMGTKDNANPLHHDRYTDAEATAAVLVPDAVTGSHIAAGTITGADVAADAITGAHIADGTITGADVSSTADLAVGTVTATTFSGSGSAALDFLVNNTRTLRLESSGDAPNLIGGSSGNTVTSGLYGATIGGGGSIMNVNQVTADFGTVGGGSTNTASGSSATVGGGGSNTASGSSATVGGGYTNNASGLYATVGGGRGNTASGIYATAGGYYNVAGGGYSFAAGRRAKANHNGSFVWADSAGGASYLLSTANDQFMVRASGGTKIYSNSTATVGVELAAGGGSWSAVSDRNLKTNFRDEDGEKVLAAIADMPVPSWNYKSQDPSIRHLGPMAQDFYAAFGLGEDDKRINTVDIDGINLLAIQALEKRTRELAQLKAELAAVKAENEAMKAQMARFESALQRLETVTMARDIAEGGETTVAEVTP